MMTMNLDPLQEKICAAIDSAREEIISISHQIHANPELGGQEVFASSLLAETLESNGFVVFRGYMNIPTSFCASKRGGKGKPCVSFLAEYDALPDIGHGCGHNVIAAASLAAGIGMGAVISDIGGEVRVIGTPAEETDGAKVYLVKDNAFDDVDLSLMIHPNAGNFYLTESLALDQIQFEFFGKTSHASSSPWEGLNALDALLLAFSNINALRQQLKPDARIHGIITKGGAAVNMIPDYTAAKFNIRARDRDYLDVVVEKFKDCAYGAAKATGTRVEIKNYEGSFDDMLNNLALAERVRDYAGSLGSGPFQRAPTSFGSVDMGNVSHVVPAVHLLMDITRGIHVSLHTSEFQQAARTAYADEVILRSGKAMALTAYDAITKPEFLDTVRQEFVANKNLP